MASAVSAASASPMSATSSSDVATTIRAIQAVYAQHPPAPINTVYGQCVQEHLIRVVDGMISSITLEKLSPEFQLYEGAIALLKSEIAALEKEMHQFETGLYEWNALIQINREQEAKIKELAKTPEPQLEV